MVNDPPSRMMMAESVARVETVIASASEAIHRATKEEWIASSLPFLAMTATIFRSPGTGRRASHFKQPAVCKHGFAISPRLPREVYLNFASP
jgi:hypothetical protein